MINGLGCFKCGQIPRIEPIYGGFTTRCGCPPVQTITTNNTWPLKKQEALGEDFERVLHDNIWDLYAR